MTPGRLLARLHEIGALAWLRFVQVLNWAALALAAALVMIHQVYPQLVVNLLSQLSPWAGIPLIFLFCLAVHYALRRAKKDA